MQTLCIPPWFSGFSGAKIKFESRLAFFLFLLPTHLAIDFCICFNAVRQKNRAYNLCTKSETPATATVGVSSRFMAKQTKARCCRSHRLAICKHSRRLYLPAQREWKNWSQSMHLITILFFCRLEAALVLHTPHELSLSRIFYMLHLQNIFRFYNHEHFCK